MHIAICIDNAADRKQCERLMGREADKWIKAGDPIYSFSFGSTSALLYGNLEYDAVIVDITEEKDVRNIGVINQLKEKNVHSCIIDCAETCDEAELEIMPNTFFLQKPIRPTELSEVLKKVSEVKKLDPGKIELRGEKQTLYVTEDEIIYGVENGNFVDITLTGGRSISVYTNAETFFDNIEGSNPTFVMGTSKTIINLRHVTKYRLGKVTLTDGTAMKIQAASSKYAKYVWGLVSQGSEEDLEKLEELKD